MLRLGLLITLTITFNYLELNLCESRVLSRHPKIVIIGAGAAGIAAASELLENSFINITILEAENRIGGRIHTVKFGENYVDLGAQWVHGQEGNVAYDLADPLELLEKKCETHESYTFYDSVGNSLSKNVSTSIENFINNVIPRGNPKIRNYESLGEYVEKEFNDYFKNNSQVFTEKKKFLRNLELNQLSQDSSNSWHEISTKVLEEYQSYPGDPIVNWKKRGFSTILDVLMKRYPSSENELPIIKNTILNCEVVSIDYSSSEGRLPVSITTKTRSYEADHVIVTIPLGVLKEQHTSIFNPPLPHYKRKAIESIGFGNVAKIFLLFQKPFWKLKDSRYLEFRFLWNEVERKIVENDLERKWLIGMYCAMTVEHKPNVLELWITGRYSKYMEQIPEEKVFEYAVENLNRFLGKSYNITAPVAMLRTQWYSNSHFRGTYSYKSVESNREKVSAEMIEAPLIPENLTVLFAGEATSKHRFFTVDGAISSGWKAANRLLIHYNRAV